MVSWTILVDQTVDSEWLTGPDASRPDNRFSDEGSQNVTSCTLRSLLNATVSCQEERAREYGNHS